MLSLRNTDIATTRLPARVQAAIIAVVINRARNLLNRSVIEGQAAQDLSRFFSPEIAD